MATKDLILTDKGVARYRTRMMKAGDSVTMDGPSAKLWERMGWAQPAPVKRKVAQETAEPVIPSVEEVLAAEVVEDKPAEAPKAAPKAAAKAAPKRTTTRKRTRKPAAKK
jgi:hypothetical protein